LSRAACLVVLTVLLAACGHAPSRAAGPAPASTTASPTAIPGSPRLPPLRVLGLGDSVMAGTNCGCKGLVEEYGDALAAQTHRAVHVDNLGSNGAIASDVLHELSDPRTRALVVRADVVVLTVGANDLVPQLQAWRTSTCEDPCFRGPVREMGRTVDRVLHELEVARGGRNDHVLVTDYWNVFQDGRVALDTDGRAGVAWSSRVTAAANDAICRAARAQGAVCVDLLAPFKGSGRDPTPLLADDGDHPNAAGVQVIVHALMRATPTDL
jgi:lysophospholipase L1-like esterase